LVIQVKPFAASFHPLENFAMHPQHRFDAVLPAPFGALGVRIVDGQLTGLEFLPPGTSLIPPSTPLLEGVEHELKAYYANAGHRFNLPITPVGTSFRQRVWAALLAIPVGQVITYGELARRVGSAPRAVGQAVGDNPLPILVPCHRVIAANGGLGGFMHSRVGFSQDIKRWLLRHEDVL
jgi:methylated-DNA-[protein]-cysteine S-methyltransferase